MSTSRILLTLCIALAVATGCASGSMVLRESDGETAVYTGSAALTGTYTLRPEYGGEADGMVCFVPDAASQKRVPLPVPVPGADYSSHYMCFERDEATRRLLGLDRLPDIDSACYKGEAWVRVQDYNAHIAENSGVSTAKLVDARVARPASPVPCAALWD